MVNLRKDDTCVSCVHNKLCNFKSKFLDVVDGLCSEYMKQLEPKNNPTWFICCNNYNPISITTENTTEEYGDLYE